MQNQYVGDIGDFAKYGLLRALGEGQKLGVAWYLFPDEPQKTDGKYIDYLHHPNEWRDLAPVLFDRLRSIVQRGPREVQQIEVSGLLGNAVFSNVLLKFEGDIDECATQRAKWFQGVLNDLDDCTLVFADPDNGLCEDRIYASADHKSWKRMPMSEAQVLAAGRTGVLYHHNTRMKGGHLKEIQYWLTQLGVDALALYWRRYSNRTFFIIHPTIEIKRRVQEVAIKWAPHFELHTFQEYQFLHSHQNDEPVRKGSVQTSICKLCPECGHVFRGSGWSGIDAHWRAHHEDIMPYEFARDIIRRGGKPSTEESGR